MKPTGINCPHCQQEFNEDQLKKLWAEYCGKKKTAAKSKAAAANGRKGGRPVTYFQDLYNSIPLSIEQARDRLNEWKQRYIFDVVLVPANDPVSEGFYLKCDNILWHVRWNPNNSHVEAFQNNRQVVGYNNVNNSSKTSAKRLVEDIHRAKLMSMPEDNSDILQWIKQHSLR